MKKTIISCAFMISLCHLTSCYSYTTVVGNGPKGKEEVTKWNSYFLGGLIKGNTSDAKELAKGATDYSVHTRFTILNWLVNGLTLGIYSPSTTTVTK